MALGKHSWRHWRAPMNPNGYRAKAALFLGLLAVSIWSATAGASDQFVVKPITVFQGKDAALWDRVELLEDRSPGIKKETFPPQGAQADPWIIKWFGGI